MDVEIVMELRLEEFSARQDLMLPRVQEQRKIPQALITRIH